MKTVKKLILSLSCGLSAGIFGMFFMTGNPYFLLGLATFAVASYFVVKN